MTKMMTKIYMLLSVLFTIMFLSGCIGKIPQEEEKKEDKTQANYSMEDVQFHNKKEDCRTTVDGNVYDITKAFGNHKGGDDAILSLCGIDGSDKFNNKHGENEQAKLMLSGMQIGTLE